MNIINISIIVMSIITLLIGMCYAYMDGYNRGYRDAARKRLVK